MIKDFLNDTDAAGQLLALLDHSFDAIVAVLPNSAKIAVALASELAIPIIEYWEDDTIEVRDEWTKLLVVDDGVETGRKALSIAKQLGEDADKFLAVPVCSREIEARLLQVYTKIYAVKRPFVRRSLDWHYEVRPNYSPAEARSILNRALD